MSKQEPFYLYRICHSDYKQDVMNFCHSARNHLPTTVKTILKQKVFMTYNKSLENVNQIYRLCFKMIILCCISVYFCLYTMSELFTQLFTHYLLLLFKGLKEHFQSHNIWSVLNNQINWPNIYWQWNKIKHCINLLNDCMHAFMYCTTFRFACIFLILF